MQQHSKFIEYLNSFTSLPNEFINVINKNLVVRKIKKGEIYFNKGSYTKKFGCLIDGIMRIYDIDESGNEWNKVILSPPNLLLGDPDFQKKSTYYIDAITPCEVIECPIEFLNEALVLFPEAKEVQTKILLQLYSDKSEREYDFQTLSAKERYLKLLKTHTHIIDKIPQFHIASYLGITSTQLSRINVSIRNQQM